MSESLPIFQYVRRAQGVWGTRVFADGLVEEYSDEEIDFSEAGQLIARAVPLAWRFRAQLTPAETQRLVNAIRQSLFFTLPVQFTTPPPALDGATVVWSAALDGEQHEVTTRGHAQERHPTLEGLRVLFEELVADALNRD